MICSMKATGFPCSEQYAFARGLEVAAARCLGECGYPALRRVACEYRDGTITLRGRVPSYFLKQLAQSVVRHCAGVKRVENCLQVEPESPLDERNPRKSFV